MTWIRAVLCGVGLTVVATAYAGGSKRTAESCSSDDECSRSHCHTKEDGNKVCVDCSSSKISDLRGQIKTYCKNAVDYPRKCDVIPRTEEASEIFFKIRIENSDKCSAARKDENNSCWDGGNQGHKDA